MSKTHPRGLRAVALAALVSGTLLLSACSAPSPDGGGGSTEAPPLTVAAVSAPNSLDTAQLVDGQQMFVWSSIYDTLLMRDVETGVLSSNAAESWEYNEDGTTLTLKLRSGMTFSNGNPVNAEAVVATMQRNMETPGIVQPKYRLVSGVEATDDLTAVVTFTEFDPQFEYNLALGAGAIGDPASLDSAEAATNPVGSGPYTLSVDNTVPGTSYVLQKRDDYWNAEAFPFPTFGVKVLQDSTASFNALQSGEVDAASVQAQLIGQLDTNTFTIGVVEGQSLAYLNVLDRGGEKWPALGDQRVREAINLAIDREGILTGIYQSNGASTSQVFSPVSPVFDEALNETYTYDPERGRQLVEEAGFTGETFQIPSTFLTTSVEATLSQAFSDIGLGLEWVSVPPQQAQTALTSGDYGLTYQVTGANSVPADAFYHYGKDGFGNPRGYTDATIDGLFDTINSTIDEEQALPAYEELNRYGVEQAFEAPVAFLNTSWVGRDGVTPKSVAGVPQTVRNFQFNAE